LNGCRAGVKLGAGAMIAGMSPIEKLIALYLEAFDYCVEHGDFSRYDRWLAGNMRKDIEQCLKEAAVFDWPDIR
jgi:hypothetical protein